MAQTIIAIARTFCNTVSGSTGNTFQRVISPLQFHGDASYQLMAMSDERARNRVLFPGAIDGSIPIRWMCSTMSSCSLISDEALSRTTLKTRRPYSITYHKLTDEDDVVIRCSYTGKPFKVLGRIKVPLDLQDDVQVDHFCWIVPSMPNGPDLLLGMEFIEAFGFSVHFQDGKLLFVRR